MARFGSALLLLTAALVAVPAAGRAGAPVVANGRVECVEDADKDDAGRAADEALCLDATAGAVRRDGGKLVLKRADGAETVFDSNPAACAGDDVENCHVVSLVAYDAGRGFAVVEEGFYEALSVNLVDLKRGDKVDILARPHFSPSGDQMVAVVADLMNEPDFEILVYDLKQAPFRRVFEAKRGTAGKYARADRAAAMFDFAGWIGEDRVRLAVVNDEQKEVGAAFLDRANGKWRLRGGRPK